MRWIPSSPRKVPPATRAGWSLLSLAFAAGFMVVALGLQASTPTAFGAPRALAASPALWVAEGNGLVIYGAGERVNLAPIEAPEHPVSALDLTAPVSGAAVVGSFAYLAQDGLGLRVVDLTLPDQPADLGLIPFEGTAFRMTQWADFLLVASDRSLTVLQLGSAAMSGMDMTMMGDHAMMHMANMMQIDPFALGEVASLPLAGTPVAVAASGTQAFVATAEGELSVIDLSDRSAPKLLRTESLSTRVTALAPFRDGVAVGVPGGIRTAASDGRFSGPRIPGAVGLASSGRLMFVAAGDAGLFAVRDESAPEATVNVNVGNFFFQPSTANINQGDIVHWNWVGGSHSTTSGSCSSGNCAPDGLWDSGVLGSGTFDRTFNTVGTFPYFCSIHLSSMTGKIVVAGTGPPPLSATASGSPTSGTPPLAVTFTGAASGGTPPYTYSWALGDGSASTNQSPAHTYTQIGVYTAVLTVQDSAAVTAHAPGVTITVSQQTVQPPVVASIVKVGPPFTLVATGSNLQSGITVSIDGTPWSGVLWKSTTKIKITGGKALKALLPKGTTHTFLFTNPDGGSATHTYSR